MDRLGSRACASTAPEPMPSTFDAYLSIAGPLDDNGMEPI